MQEYNNKIFHSTQPYPEIKVQGENLYYAEILMDDFAGSLSEYTAIGQYLNHSFYSRKVVDDLANMWIQIAIVEMHHLDILAQLITLLGGRPVYRESF